VLRNHGSILYQIGAWLREEAAPGHDSASRAPNQHQYELSHCPLLLNINILRPLFTVFRIPTELILSILSHISPEPQLTGDYARFREQYCMEINDDHQERARFLRPLSMTCRLMRLRLVPLMWNLVEPSRNIWFRDSEGFEQNLIAIANASQADKFLAASVKYCRALLCACPGADSHPPKVHDRALPIEW